MELKTQCRERFKPAVDAINEIIKQEDNTDRPIEDGVKEAIAPLLVKFGSYGKAPKVERVTIDEMAERYRKAGI